MYAAGVLSFKYQNSDGGNDGWSQPLLLPELSRCAVVYRPGPLFYAEAGRISFSDATELVASGMFDGFRIQAVFNAGSLSASALYTGLLYKEYAEVLMTASDSAEFAEPWGFDSGGYFASRRLLAALRWDAPLAGYNTATVEALAQFDLNNRGADALHSQYLAALVELFPQGKAALTVAALFEAMENNEGVFSAALGAAARLRMDVPGALNDGIAIALKFGSGAWGNAFAAFTPVSAHPQGMSFNGTMSGLALLSLGYSARLHEAVSIDANLRYFMRTYDKPEQAGKLLYGAELQAAVNWQPFDDLRFNLSGGAFFPGMGNIYPKETSAQWKINAGFTLSL